MIVKKVKMTNFKTHSNSEIDFDTGITIIIGENGAGKTSILEAISFALFKENTANIEDLRTLGKKNMEVTVDFRSAGKEFRVVCKKRGNQSTRELYESKNGTCKLIQTGDRGVAAEVEQILGIDKTIFINAIYIRQGEIDKILSPEAANRKKVVGQLLGIEEVQKAWELMGREGGVIREFESKKNVLNGEISQKQGIQTNIKNKDNELNEVRESLATLTNDFEIKNNEYFKILKVWEELNKKKITFTEIREKLNAANNESLGKHSDLEKREKALQKIIVAEIEIKKLKPDVEKYGLLESLKEYKDHENHIQQEINRLKKEITKINEWEGKLKSTENIFIEYNEIKEQIESLEEQKKGVEGSKTKYEQLQKDIDHLKKKLADLEKEISSMVEKSCEILGISKCTPEMLRKKRDEILNTEKVTLEEIKGQLEALNSNFSELKGNKDPINKSINILETSEEDVCPTCGTELTEEHKQEILTEYKREIKSIDIKLKSLKAQKKDLEDIQQEKQEKLDKISKINIDLLEKNVSDYHQKNNEKKEKEVESKTVKSQTELLTGFEKEISMLKAHIKEFQEPYDEYIFAKKNLSEADKDELQKQIDAFNGELIEALGHITGIIKKLGYEPENVSKDLKTLKEKRDLYNNYLGSVKEKQDVVKEIDDINDKISKLEERIGELRNSLASLNYNEKEHDAANQNKNTLEEEVKRIKEKKDKSEQKKEELEKQIIELNDRLLELGEKEREFKKLSNFIMFLNEIRSLLDKDKLQNEIRKKSKPLITKYAMEFFNAFDLPYSGISLTDDYSIVLHGPNGEQKAEMISGGEKIAAALALRVGIAKALSKGKMELLILDEPTIHLDQIRKQELVSLMRNLVTIPQTIVVTHDEEFEQAADAVIKVRKQNGVSEVTMKD